MSYSPSEPASETELTDIDHHRVLTDERRRVVLDVLTTETTPIELQDLAAAITTRETNAEVPSNEDVERVAISLHHKHLPILTEAGAIRYEPTSNRIEATYVATDVP